MQRIALLAMLAGCTRADTDSGLVDTGDSAAPPIDPLPTSPIWESAEREYATGLALCDVDGDGVRDLVVSNGNDMRPGPISVHFGPDLPQTPDLVRGSAYHGQLQCADVDGDGYDDVVVSRYIGVDQFDSPGGVDLWRGGPAGGSATPDWSFEGIYTFGLALGDLDNDADLDLAVAVGEPYTEVEGPQLVFVNDGSGFGADPDWSSADVALGLAVRWADVDADADLDLIETRSGSPHAIYRNDDGALTDQPAWLAPGDGFDGNLLDAADLDGDGLPELLIADNTYAGGSGRLHLYSSTFEVLRETEGGTAWSAVSLVDVDDDGELDAVAGSWWGSVVIWPGARIDEPPSWESETSTVVEAFAWGDLHGGPIERIEIVGDRLVPLCTGCTAEIVSGRGVVGPTAVAGPGEFGVRIERPRGPDLAVSNWDPEIGSYLFVR